MISDAFNGHILVNVCVGTLATQALLSNLQIKYPLQAATVKHQLLDHDYVVAGPVHKTFRAQPHTCLADRGESFLKKTLARLLVYMYCLQ